jgi:hypothetical protein
MQTFTKKTEAEIKALGIKIKGEYHEYSSAITTAKKASAIAFVANDPVMKDLPEVKEILRGKTPEKILAETKKAVAEKKAKREALQADLQERARQNAAILLGL